MLERPPEPRLPQPNTPKGRATLQRILDTGAEVFGEVGYVQMRMSDLAERAGLSMGALYRYFDNKDDVFLAIIHDIHNELYAAGTPADEYRFKTAPLETIYEANRGYLAHYAKHGRVMRAFIEATMVDGRYTHMWWYMRERHIRRVASALARDHGLREVNGQPVRMVLETLVSMTEQSAFVWFARPVPEATPPRLEDAVKMITMLWYNSFFVSSQTTVDRQKT
ncbi:TetR/AcrR family transcriptional regulator [Hyphomicrobiales bacterium]|nr:TetR/AcrR family transcriptional regulator [Hyphomicrobiales bacterium]CAH1692341.1 TetR/AcrR family transcriptional regulator [Hyphomicrobiales bacterium]